METTQSTELLKVTRLAGTILLENGAETSRVEETIERICSPYADDVDVMALPTGIFITLWKDGQIQNSMVKRVKKRNTNLQKLSHVNDISRKLANGVITLEQALPVLKELSLSQIPRKSQILYPFYTGMSTGIFTLLYGGSLIDALISFFCGCFVQWMCLSFKRTDIFHFAISLLGGIVISTIAVLLSYFFGIGDVEKVIIGSIVPLLPGLAMTKAIRDTMMGDLVSGVARFAEVLLVAVTLASGVGFVLSIVYLAGGGMR